MSAQLFYELMPANHIFPEGALACLGFRYASADELLLSGKKILSCLAVARLFFKIRIHINACLR